MISQRCTDAGAEDRAPARSVEIRGLPPLTVKLRKDGPPGYTAEAIGESIFTGADSWDELRANVKEAVRAFYFDSAPPASVRLRLVRDEVLAVA